MSILPVALKRHQLLASVDHDETLARDMIRLFEREAPRQLAVIRAAVESADFAAVAAAAHSFRGSAANFGTDPVVDSLVDLEESAGQTDLQGCVTLIGRIDAQTAALLEVLRVSEEPVRCAS